MKRAPADRIGLHQAKTHFSELLRRVEAGEEITILRRGEAVARLVPAKESAVERPLGRLRDQWQLPEASELVAPDPDVDALFYGGDG